MTSELPQRVPGAPTTTAVSGDPDRYAAVVRALRATPAERFPALIETAYQPAELSTGSVKKYRR